MTSSTLKDNGLMPRKTLATQLDRLDEILDGLADSLNDAVSQAVKDAVGLAVQEAVQGVLTEVLTNPELLNKLRPEAVPLGAPLPPAAPLPAVKGPGWLSRLTGLAQGVSGKVVNLAKQTSRKVAQRVSGVWQSVSASLTKASTRVKMLVQGLWAFLRGAAGVACRVRKSLFIALGVGSALGLGCYLAGPVVSSAVSGLAGFIGSLVASTANSLRRAFLGVNIPDA